MVESGLVLDEGDAMQWFCSGSETNGETDGVRVYVADVVWVLVSDALAGTVAVAV